MGFVHRLRATSGTSRTPLRHRAPGLRPLRCTQQAPRAPLVTTARAVGGARARKVVACGVGLVLVVGGCALVPGPTEEYWPAPAAVQASVDCSTSTGWEGEASHPPGLLKGRVPEGFVTVAVVRCTHHIPGTLLPTSGAVLETVSEDHLTGDYAPLLAALAAPSERGGAISCLDYGEILPDIWLINAEGQSINIQWPMDACGHAKPDTAKALAALTVSSSIPVPAPESALVTVPEPEMARTVGP